MKNELNREAMNQEMIKLKQSCNLNNEWVDYPITDQ